jgi:O-antigen/teichoic acid export membrane protein
MKEDTLTKRYSIKLFSNIIGSVIGAILVAIVPKALGPVDYGHFVYLRDIFTKITAFLDLGTSTALFTKLSAKQARKELLSFYLIYILFVLITLFLLVALINLFSYQNVFLPGMASSFVFIGLLYGFLSWVTQVFIKISDAYALTVSVELIKLGHRLLSLLLLIYFINYLQFNLKVYFYFNYISLVSLLLILTVLFMKKGIFQNLKFKLSEFKVLTKEFLEYCSPLFLYSLLAIGSGLFDIWLLQKTSGSIQTGFYGLAYSLAAMCFLLTSAMTPILMREFSKSYEQKDLENMRKLFFRYVPMLYALAAYFAMFISMQSYNVLAIFTDEHFSGAYWVLVIMATYPIHQTYGQLSGSLFYATGQTKLMRNISFFTIPIGMLISIVLILVLDLKAVGLASKMIIIQLVATNVQLYFNGRLLHFKIKSFLFHQFYTVIFFAGLAYISSIQTYFKEPLLNFLVAGFIYTILVAFFSYVFPQIFSTSRKEIKLVSSKLLLKLNIS